MSEAHMLSNWRTAALPAAWLIATFGALLTFPVRLSSVSQGPQLVLGLVTILLTLALSLLHSMGSRHARNRSRLRIALLLCGLLLFSAWVGYAWLMAAWTCPYSGNAVLVIADTPQSDLVQYMKQSGRGPGDAFDCQLVKEYAGETTRMFAFHDLALRYYLLAALYIVCWLTLALSVWLSVQLLGRRQDGTTDR